MKVLIIGSAGMVGQKLIGKIISEKEFFSNIEELLLYDIIDTPVKDVNLKTNVMVGDISDKKETYKLSEFMPDIIFHLASIVSGEAEEKFEKGWNSNAKATWNLLEALREKNVNQNGNYIPKLVFTSSIAVFGPPFPNKINDSFLCAPQTSYGSQKAMLELLMSDYSRKGFIDAISIRLPTICVRPGKPNLAASSFFSGIIREPINGKEAILPVSRDVRHWHASPKSAAGFLVHAAKIDSQKLGTRRSLNMPGVSCTVDEQISALKNICGESVANLIKEIKDEKIVRIVDGWPQNFNPEKAITLGFESEKNFEEIIKVYLEDDFGKVL